jgi:hypothetical protein
MLTQTTFHKLYCWCHDLVFHAEIVSFKWLDLLVQIYNIKIEHNLLRISHVILVPSQQILLLLPNTACVVVIINFIVFDLTLPDPTI